MRVLQFKELKAVKGIRFSRQHLSNLAKAGNFPKPIKVGIRSRGWVESEIDKYLTACATDRSPSPVHPKFGNRRKRPSAANTREGTARGRLTDTNFVVGDYT